MSQRGLGKTFTCPYCHLTDVVAVETNHMRKCQQGATRVTLPNKPTECVVVQKIGKDYTCPFRGCDQKYSVPKSLQTHVKSRHSRLEDQLKEGFELEFNIRNPPVSVHSDHSHSYSTRRRSTRGNIPIIATQDHINQQSVNLDLPPGGQRSRMSRSEAESDIDTNMDTDVSISTDIVIGSRENQEIRSSVTADDNNLETNISKIIFPAYLKKYGYGILVEHNLLICTSCHQGVKPSSFPLHWKRQDTTCLKCPDSLTVLEQLKREYVLAETHFWPSHPVDSIPGFPIYDAFTCKSTGCTVTFGKISTFKREHKKVHKEHPEPCKAHIIYPQHYWPVKSIQVPQPLDLNQTMTYIRFAHQRLDDLFDQQIIHIPADPNNIRGYLVKVGWADLVAEEIPIQPLFDIVQPPKDKSSQLASLQPYVFKYFNTIHNDIYQTDYTIRRWLNSDTLKTIEPDAFRKLRNLKTLEKYSDTAFRFACMMIRHVHALVQLPLPILLSEAQNQTTKELWKLLQAEKDDDDEDEDDDEDDNEDDDKDDDEDDIILLALHNFYHALFFTQHPSHERCEDVQSRPINIFCLCISLDDRGQFVACKNITSVFSGLQFDMRLCALEIVKKTAREKKISMFDVISEFQPKFLLKDTPSPFCMLHNIMTAAAYDVYNNQGMPMFYLDQATMIATVKNQEINLADLPKMYSGLFKKAQSLILHLTHGITMATDLNNHLHDILPNDQTDYNLLYQEKQWFVQEADKLWAYFIGERQEDWVIEFGEEKPILQPAMAKLFMDGADELCKTLLILYHISSGQPGRGTEVISLTYRNGGGTGGLRNLYWTLNQLVFVSKYNKNNKNGKETLIPRFPPQDVATIILQYLIYICSIQIYIVEHLETDITKRNHMLCILRDYIWVRNGEQWTSPQLSNELAHQCQKYLDADIGVSLWRHLAAGLKVILQAGKSHEQIEEDDREEVDIYDAQQGHTTEVARNFYAITRQQVGKLNPILMNTYLLASQQWQIKILLQSIDLRSSLHSSTTFKEPGISKKEFKAYQESIETKLSVLLKEVQGLSKKSKKIKGKITKRVLGDSSDEPSDNTLSDDREDSDNSGYNSSDGWSSWEVEEFSIQESSTDTNDEEGRKLRGQAFQDPSNLEVISDVEDPPETTYASTDEEGVDTDEEGQYDKLIAYHKREVARLEAERAAKLQSNSDPSTSSLTQDYEEMETDEQHVTLDLQAIIPKALSITSEQPGQKDVSTSLSSSIRAQNMSEVNADTLLEVQLSQFPLPIKSNSMRAKRLIRWKNRLEQHVASGQLKFLYPEWKEFYLQALKAPIPSVLPLSFSDATNQSSITTLQKIFKNPQASWKSEHQKQSYQLLVNQGPHILCIAGTGAGKTLPVIVAAKEMRNDDIMVFTTPYIALYPQIYSALDQAGVEHLHWDANGREKLSITAKPFVLTSSVEGLASNKFSNWLAISHMRVKYIILDEASCFIGDSNWRKAFRFCHQVLQQNQKTKLYLMTATCPFGFEKGLWKVAGINNYPSNNIYNHRTPTARTNIKWSVHRYPSNLQSNWERRVIYMRDYICDTLPPNIQPHERVLVFTNSKRFCESMAKALGCDYIHGDVIESERQRIYKKWAGGTGSFYLVGNKAITFGVDNPNVIATYQLELYKDINDIIQAAGRGGRSTSTTICEAHILVQKPAEYKEPTMIIPVDFRGGCVVEFLAQSKACIPQLLSSFQDGFYNSINCKDLQESLKCSNCDNFGSDAYWHPIIYIPEWPGRDMVDDALIKTKHSHLFTTWRQRQSRSNLLEGVINFMRKMNQLCPGCWIPLDDSHRPWSCPKIPSLIPMDIKTQLQNNEVIAEMDGLTCEFILWKRSYLPVNKGVDERCFYCLCPYHDPHFHEIPRDNRTKRECKFGMHFPILLFRLLYEDKWLSEFSEEFDIPSKSCSQKNWLDWFQVEERDGVTRGLLTVVSWVYLIKFLPYIEKVIKDMERRKIVIPSSLAMLMEDSI